MSDAAHPAGHSQGAAGVVSLSSLLSKEVEAKAVCNEQSSTREAAIAARPTDKKKDHPPPEVHSTLSGVLYRAPVGIIAGAETQASTGQMKWREGVNKCKLGVTRGG
jgi:hypothetical protein